MIKCDLAQGSIFEDWYLLGRDYSKGNKYRYYLCLCVCGVLKSVLGQSLYIGVSTSCGCKIAKGVPRERKSLYQERALTYIINNYKAHSKQRKQEFDIERPAFAKLISQNCFWCGSIPNNIINGETIFNLNGSDHSDYKFYYNGLGRLDNSKSYTEDNVVPCCYICNRARNNLSVEAFEAWLQNLVAFRNKQASI